MRDTHQFIKKFTKTLFDSNGPYVHEVCTICGIERLTYEAYRGRPGSSSHRLYINPLGSNKPVTSFFKCEKGRYHQTVHSHIRSEHGTPMVITKTGEQVPFVKHRDGTTTFDDIKQKELMDNNASQDKLKKALQDIVSCHESSIIDNMDDDYLKVLIGKLVYSDEFQTLKARVTDT